MEDSFEKKALMIKHLRAAISLYSEVYMPYDYSKEELIKLFKEAVEDFITRGYSEYHKNFGEGNPFKIL